MRSRHTRSLCDWRSDACSSEPTFTPATGVNTQTAQIQVLAGGWSDASSNAGTASNMLSITEDTKAPTVVVSASSTTLAAGQDGKSGVDGSGAGTGCDRSDVRVT